MSRIRRVTCALAVGALITAGGAGAFPSNGAKDGPSNDNGQANAALTCAAAIDRTDGGANCNHAR